MIKVGIQSLKLKSFLPGVWQPPRRRRSDGRRRTRFYDWQMHAKLSQQRCMRFRM